MKKFLLSICAGLIIVAIPFPSSAEVTYTKDMIEEILKDKATQKLHRVMILQRNNLKLILDGFLIGDAELIRQNTQEVADNMRDIIGATSSTSSSANSANMWSTMSDIVVETQKLKETIDAEDYPGAYKHYTNIVSNCISCHQIARSWGKFDKIKKEIAPEDLPIASNIVSNEAAAVADTTAPAEPEKDEKKQVETPQEIEFGKPYTLQNKTKKSSSW